MKAGKTQNKPSKGLSATVTLAEGSATPVNALFCEFRGFKGRVSRLFGHGKTVSESLFPISEKFSHCFGMLLIRIFEQAEVKMITVLIHIMETQDGVLMEEHTSSVLGKSTIAESQVLKELEEKIKDLKMKSDSNSCRFCRCFKSEEPEDTAGKCIYYGLKVSSGFGCRSWTGRF